MRPRVVLIDDDDLFRESIRLNLCDEGFEVVDFTGGLPALAYFSAGESADAIILDWKMPELNGLDVLCRLRDARITLPVIFLTALGDDLHEDLALAGGAIDFIDKSRRLSIVVKRLQLILGRQSPAESGAESGAEIGAGIGAGIGAEIGAEAGPKTAPAKQPAPEPLVTSDDPTLRRHGYLDLRVDICRAWWRSHQLDLTLTEFHILRLLVERAGEDVSYREIYDLVHGKSFLAGYGPEGYRANVRALIKRIRLKFRNIDDEFGEIENYPGFGYRWLARSAQS